MQKIWRGSDRRRNLAAVLARTRVDGNGCYIWQAARDRDGYGRLTVDGRSWRAHRYVFTIVHGDPGPKMVCHLCGVPACVRPDHLAAGTALSNAADREHHRRRRHPSPVGGQIMFDLESGGGEQHHLPWHLDDVHNTVHGTVSGGAVREHVELIGADTGAPLPARQVDHGRQLTFT